LRQYVVIILVGERAKQLAGWVERAVLGWAGLGWAGLGWAGWLADARRLGGRNRWPESLVGWRAGLMKLGRLP